MAKRLFLNAAKGKRFRFAGRFFDLPGGRTSVEDLAKAWALDPTDPEHLKRVENMALFYARKQIGDVKAEWVEDAPAPEATKAPAAPETPAPAEAPAPEVPKPKSSKPKKAKEKPAK